MFFGAEIKPRALCKPSTHSTRAPSPQFVSHSFCYDFQFHNSMISEHIKFQFFYTYGKLFHGLTYDLAWRWSRWCGQPMYSATVVGVPPPRLSGLQLVHGVQPISCWSFHTVVLSLIWGSEDSNHYFSIVFLLFISFHFMYVEMLLYASFWETELLLLWNVFLRI